MKADPHIDSEWAWNAVLRRDRNADGRFVTGVLSTGIYCRPSCAARHPRRENVQFFANGIEALKAGLRPCLRCRPDEVSREQEAIKAAIDHLGRMEGKANLGEVARAVGYSPFHFHRLFKKATGVTPAAYFRGLRAQKMIKSLAGETRVTDAIYEAGYSGSARFYADAKERLGMKPGVWRDGGRGEVIRWATAETYLGTMLVAATERGICRISFDEGEEDLKKRFPNATLQKGDGAMEALVQKVVDAVNAPERPHDLPLDIRGTAFQQAVWRELARIPPGETLSYSELAAKAGKPGAARAAGTACGANHIAILIPCHRALRGDGSLGGYEYGLERKIALLEREGTSKRLL